MKINTKCGLFAIYNFDNPHKTVEHTINGLATLQHRGQESAGIAYIPDTDKLTIYKNNGLVENIFKNFPTISTTVCIGHVRYSTSGRSMTENEKLLEAQPLLGENKFGQFAMAFNGNLPHFKSTKEEVSDTFYLLKLFETTDAADWEELLQKVDKIVKGVYCILILAGETLFIMRDRYGYKPYCIGISRDKVGWCISSESYAINQNGEYGFFRDISPGEISCISHNAYRFIHQSCAGLIRRCMFEYIYFMNPASVFDGLGIDEIRYKFGEKLAQNDQYHYETDKTIVVGCPNSGIIGGKGYAAKKTLAYLQVIKKKKHIQRSFIMPSDEERVMTCKTKYEIDAAIKDKIVILVDDSIVRGNTLRILIKVLFEKGCKEVHIRVASPPIKHPCFYGIDIPTYEELIAHKLEIDEIRKYIGANTLMYLDVKDMSEIFASFGMRNQLCSACFDGKYNRELTNW